MSENEFELGSKQIIVNGGDPLPGCPESWDQAREWETKANEDKDNMEPAWSFDCGFKLDFDGPIISLSSRFYPPKKHYGPKWDGNCTLYVLGKEIVKQRFEEDSLDQLKAVVELWLMEIMDELGYVGHG